MDRCLALYDPRIAGFFFVLGWKKGNIRHQVYNRNVLTGVTPPLRPMGLEVKMKTWSHKMGRIVFMLLHLLGHNNYRYCIHFSRGKKWKNVNTKWLLCFFYALAHLIHFSRGEKYSVVDPKLFIPDPDPALNFPSSGSGSGQKFRIQPVLIWQV